MRIQFKTFRAKHFIILILLLSSALLAFRDSDRYFQIARNLDIFAAFYRELSMYYVEDLPPEQLIRSGIEGILTETDPYTSFVGEESLEELSFIATGTYGGVGVSVSTQQGDALVTEVYPNTPMFRAGVKPGDVLERLNGVPTAGMEQEQISSILKGKAGTPLIVDLRKPGQTSVQHLEIIREDITVHPISYSGIVADQIGFIKVNQFTEQTGKQVGAAFQKLKDQQKKLTGIILDLRGNPGGLLEEAVILSNLFIDKGSVIVSTKGKTESWNAVFKTSSNPLDTQIPLIVLTDRQSASAAEIVAGAVQDLDRGLVLGQRSFGKGLVQTTRNLPYNTKLKVTAARYYTPSGRCIQAIDYGQKMDGSSNHQMVPDSLRNTFVTKQGRIVRDGGGIEPDSSTSPRSLSPIAVSLLRKQYIFNFATDYYHKNPTAIDPEKFSINDATFQAFTEYLEDKDYSYKTKSEELLAYFKTVAETEQYYNGFEKEYEALLAKFAHDKKQDLLKHQSEIKQLLSEEIVNRYYPLVGRLVQSLKQDADVQLAIQLFKDPKTYQSLLSGK
jgi:carboxyl-terminal processing protease